MQMKNTSQLTELVYQHTNDITDLARHLNELDANLKTLTRNQAKLEQLIEAQIKTNFDIAYIKEHLQATSKNITIINAALKNIETNLLRKEAESLTKLTLFGHIKKFIPALIGLCVVMFVLGVALNDIHFIKPVLGLLS